MSKLIGEEKVTQALPYFHKHFNRVMLEDVTLLLKQVGYWSPSCQRTATCGLH